MKHILSFAIMFFVTMSVWGQSVICQGNYTLTGVSRGSAGFSSSGMPLLCNLTVYDDYMTFAGDATAYPYRGQYTIYGETGRRYGDGNSFFLVTSSGDVRGVVIMSMTLPYVGTVTETTLCYYDKGDTRYLYQSAGTTGGGYSTPQNSYTPSAPRQQSCRICYGTGNCQTCYGSGWVNNPYVNERHPCTSCNNGGNQPNRGKCWNCGGTGKK